jgi:hypothetical protein
LIKNITKNQHFLALHHGFDILEFLKDLKHGRTLNRIIPLSGIYFHKLWFEDPHDLILERVRTNNRVIFPIKKERVMIRHNPRETL